MASEDTKAKAEPAPKSAPKSTPTSAPKSEAAASDKVASDATPSSADAGGKAGAASAGYSRGEGQKPVTQAYKDNWNAIFGKKPARKTKKKRKQ